GCALGRAGRAAEAVPPLRAAVEGDPSDRQAARALYQALCDSGDHTAAGLLAQGRRLLTLAAPQLVPAEPWFAEPPSAPPPRGRGRLQPLPPEAFRRRFGAPDTSRAVCAFTPPADTGVVLTLLAHARPRRILEVGTALGHMTANLTEWAPDDALVFT